MITDKEINLVYLADSLMRKETEPYRAFFLELMGIFNECNVKFSILPMTRNIWARDFMPIQVSDDHFAQFVYNPDYMQSATQQKNLSDVDDICRRINIVTEKSKLKVDGGNVVRSSNRVIMCNKVFDENNHLSDKEVKSELIARLGVKEIIFLPWDKKRDFTGHADGMVRFLDDNTVFVNDMTKPEDQHMMHQILDILQSAGLVCIKLPYNPYSNPSYTSAKGIYINYLETDSAVIVPTFGLKEDDEALKVFHENFKGKEIRSIDSNVIAKEGGILNCITWNIKKAF